MGSDDDIDASIGEPSDDPALVTWRRETTQHLDVDGIRGKSRSKDFAVLTGQNRRRHEHRNLFAVLDRFECSSNRHLGLAVADVAADQPVHGFARLHVLFDRFDRGELIGCLFERKRFFKLVLPRVVRRVCKALGHLPGFVQFDKFVGDLLDLGAYLRFLPGEVRATHLVECRAITAGIAPDRVDVFGRYIELVAAAVRDQEIVLLAAANGS